MGLEGVFGVCGGEMGLGLKDDGMAVSVGVEPVDTPLVGMVRAFAVGVVVDEEEDGSPSSLIGTNALGSSNCDGALGVWCPPFHLRPSKAHNVTLPPVVSPLPSDCNPLAYTCPPSGHSARPFRRHKPSYGRSCSNSAGALPAGCAL